MMIAEKKISLICSMTGTIILAVAYGIHVQSKDDPNIDAAEKMIAVLNTAGIPGAFLVVSTYHITVSAARGASDPIYWL